MIVAANAQSDNTGAGISLAFNGNAGNYVDLGDVFNSLTFPFSLEAWVKPVQYLPSSTAIFSSDNDLMNPTGFWIGISSAGKLQIEFEDGQGTGIEHSRGYISAQLLPLNEWSHIAVVCISITDVNLYISGVLQVKTPIDGTPSITSVTHSNAPASIGSHLSLNKESWFNGEIDEVRLWNNKLSQKSIRDYLCKKITPAPAELIGHYTCDESFSRPLLMDHTSPEENGILVGTVAKVISGAPLGDIVKYKYTDNWFEVKVTLDAPSGDRMMTQDIMGDGIFVYYVDAPPYINTGLQNSPPYYYGVYGVGVNSPSSYNVRYKYSVTDGTVTEANEGFVELMKRKDATQGWTDVDGILDVQANWITKHDGESMRGEYTIDLPVSGKETVTNVMLQDAATLIISPNPSADIIHFGLSNADQSEVFIRILNCAGIILEEIKETTAGNDVPLSVANLPNGIYVADVTTSGSHLTQRFIVQR